MKKFEYLTKYFDIGIFSNNIADEEYQKRILDNLNDLGNDGWELVTCTHMTTHTGTFMLVAFFKREK